MLRLAQYIGGSKALHVLCSSGNGCLSINKGACRCPVPWLIAERLC